MRIVLNGCTKICAVCGCELPVKNFGILKRSKDGFRPECKECRNLRNNQDSEKNVARVSKWRDKNPDRLKEQRDTWNRSDGKNSAQKKYRGSHKEQAREKHLRNKYGITLEEYNTILNSQNGVCAICGKFETALNGHGNIRNLAVDHDHETGKVRGLLCNRCNYVLGFSDDSVEVLRSMICYLEIHNAY